MVNYTIIIPHKDIPDLLQRCLNSIPRRKDVQIIVVDDNSQNVDFSDFPGKNDPYVEIIYGKNENGRKGAGYARNLGLEKANGKWIIFADADDFFNPCFNEVLDSYKGDDKNDIIFFIVDSVDNYTLLPSNRTEDRNNLIKKGLEDDLRYKFSEPWGKFIRLKLVKEKKIHFQEVAYSNDILFAVKTGINSKKISTSNIPIYTVTSRNNSLINQQTTDAIKIRLSVTIDKYRILKTIGKERYAYHGLNTYWCKLINLSKKEALKLLPSLFIKFPFSFFLRIFTLPYIRFIINSCISTFSKNNN